MTNDQIQAAIQTEANKQSKAYAQEGADDIYCGGIHVGVSIGATWALSQLAEWGYVKASDYDKDPGSLLAQILKHTGEDTQLAIINGLNERTGNKYVKVPETDQTLKVELWGYCGTPDAYKQDGPNGPFIHYGNMAQDLCEIAQAYAERKVRKALEEEWMALWGRLSLIAEECVEESASQAGTWDGLRMGGKAEGVKLALKNIGQSLQKLKNETGV